MHEPIVRLNRRENGMIGRRSEGYEERVGKKEEKRKREKKRKKTNKAKKGDSNDTLSWPKAINRLIQVRRRTKKNLKCLKQKKVQVLLLLMLLFEFKAKKMSRKRAGERNGYGAKQNAS